MAADRVDAATLDSVLGAVRYMAAVSDRPERIAGVKSRVAEEMRPFLGSRATGIIMESVSSRGDNMLSSIEPVVALFLGGRAASRLIGQVVDRVGQAIRLPCSL